MRMNADTEVESVYEVDALCHIIMKRVIITKQKYEMQMDRRRPQKILMITGFGEKTDDADAEVNNPELILNSQKNETMLMTDVRC